MDPSGPLSTIRSREYGDYVESTWGPMCRVMVMPGVPLRVAHTGVLRDG
jgi:hypothetical protein